MRKTYTTIPIMYVMPTERMSQKKMRNSVLFKPKCHIRCPKGTSAKHAKLTNVPTRNKKYFAVEKTSKKDTMNVKIPNAITAMK